MVKTQIRKIESCVDMMGIRKGKLVVIERLSEPKGLALPGGRLEMDESLEESAVREFKEETGLDFTLEGQFKTYSDPDRDPRGRKVSTLFIGKAEGETRDEEGKTRVLLIDLKDFGKLKDKFVFDHAKMLKDYLDSINLKGTNKK